MTIVRVGTNKKYSDGWEAAFGKGSSKSANKSSSKAKNVAKKSAKKKPAKRKK